MTNVEVSEAEENENLVDISELSNLWGGTGYDIIPRTQHHSVPRFSEKFEYEDEDEEEADNARGSSTT